MNKAGAKPRTKLVGGAGLTATPTLLQHFTGFLCQW